MRDELNHPEVNRSKRSSLLVLCCFAWAQCVSSALHAQLLDDRQLAIAREAKTINFAEPELNQLAPHWKIAPLKIAARDPEAALETMNEHLEQIVSEYGLLYGLSPEQETKLRTAAQLDARRFMRRLRGDHVPDLPSLIRAKEQAARIGVEFNIPCRVAQDLLGAGSYFAKMQQQLITAEQREYADQQLVLLREKWINASSADELLNWLSRRSQLSVGQRARLNSLLRSNSDSSARTAADLLKQLQATAPERLANILSQDNELRSKNCCTPAVICATLQHHSRSLHRTKNLWRKNCHE